MTLFTEAPETYQYSYKTSRSPLVPVERPLVMRALDYPGYVPIIGGVPAGALRIVSCLACAVLASLGALLTCYSEKWHGKFSFAVSYLLDECMRGIGEIFFVSYPLDKEVKWEEELNSEACHHPRRGAYGKYLYDTPFKSYESPLGYVGYSYERYERNSTEWTCSLKIGSAGQGNSTVVDITTPR